MAGAGSGGSRDRVMWAEDQASSMIPWRLLRTGRGGRAGPPTARETLHMILDHVGIAVRSIERAARQWAEAFGYQPVSPLVENGRQKVNVLFLARPGSLPVKLIEPTDASSPIEGLAQRGGGLHHLCFRCESLDAEVARLRAMGLRVLAPPQAAEAIEDGRIAFVYVGEGLTVELLQVPGQAGAPPGNPC
jgi:methylmalonyl-CoA/ethylmalonyl-CoA epimerase